MEDRTLAQIEYLKSINDNSEIIADIISSLEWADNRRSWGHTLSNVKVGKLRKFLRNQKLWLSKRYESFGINEKGMEEINNIFVGILAIIDQKRIAPENDELLQSCDKIKLEK